MLWLVARGLQGSKAGNAPTCLRGKLLPYIKVYLLEGKLLPDISPALLAQKNYLLEKLPQFHLCSPSLFVTFL